LTMSTLIPALAVKDVEASLRFYTEVLGFATQFTLPGEDGTLVHASVTRGDSSIMFGRLDERDPRDQGPLGRGVVLYTLVDDQEDINAFFQRVKAAGATVVQEPRDQFWGDRDWAISDLDGYRIQFAKHMRTVSAEEMREAVLSGAPAD
jgi:PhnB protein